MRSVLGRAHASPQDRRADGVKAVSRRRRGRASASLEAGRSPVYLKAQLLLHTRTQKRLKALDFVLGHHMQAGKATVKSHGEGMSRA
jgi:hypothetical protein